MRWSSVARCDTSANHNDRIRHFVRTFTSQCLPSRTSELEYVGAGALKMRVQKMRVRNMRVRLTGLENASTEYASTKSCIEEVK